MVSEENRISRVNASAGNHFGIEMQNVNESRTGQICEVEYDSGTSICSVCCRRYSYHCIAFSCEGLGCDFESWISHSSSSFAGKTRETTRSMCHR